MSDAQDGPDQPTPSDDTHEEMDAEQIVGKGIGVVPRDEPPDTR